MSSIVRIDVAKAKLAIVLLTPDGKALQKSCANTAAGHADLIRWLVAPHGEPRRRGARGHRRISGGRRPGAPRRRPSRERAPSQRGRGLRPESTSARENGSHRCGADCRLRPHAAASALGAAAARSAPIAGLGPAARCVARDADARNESARARRPDRAAVDRGHPRSSARRDRRHQAADRRSHRSVSDAPHPARPDRVDPGIVTDGRDRLGRIARRRALHQRAAPGCVYPSGPPDPSVRHVSPRPRGALQARRRPAPQSLVLARITAMRHNAPLHRFAPPARRRQTDDGHRRRRHAQTSPPNLRRAPLRRAFDPRALDSRHGIYVVKAFSEMRRDERTRSFDVALAAQRDHLQQPRFRARQIAGEDRAELGELQRRRRRSRSAGSRGRRAIATRP